MPFYDRNTVNQASAVSTFSTRVYSWMGLGLAVTASTAYFLAATGLYQALMPFWWVWAFAAFGVSLMMSTALQRFSIQAVAGMFIGYAFLEGILFGTILPAFAAAYGGDVIWTAFATAAIVFLSAVAYGRFTRSDLTRLGTVLTMALWGLIGITLVFFILSFFMNVQWADLIISYLGLGIFVGLTAYDAQNIRSLSMQADIESSLSYKLSLIAALRMYVNVIMIFWYLLRILSNNRRS